ncbi:MAG: hypothetical protein ACR2QJ_13305, partial [Geminicoccaceae bacterium]
MKNDIATRPAEQGHSTIDPLPRCEDDPFRFEGGSAAPVANVTSERRLLGQPSLQDHLSFVRDDVVGGHSIDAAAIAGQWREANDHYHMLEENEAGIADEIELFDPDPVLEPLIAETEADPRYVYTFDTFPTEIAMVELDRLVIYQTHLRQSYADSLGQRLGEVTDALAFYRFCQ